MNVGTSASLEAAQTLLELVSDPLLLVGSDGIILKANTAGSRELARLGVAEADADLLALVSPAHRDQARALLAHPNGHADEGLAVPLTTTARSSVRLRAIGELGLCFALLERSGPQAEQLVDGLTGLPNRAWFTGWLETSFGDPDAQAIGIVQVDLDDFRAVNDGYGHDVGDRILEAIADRLDMCSEHGLLARTGGDEFVIALPESAHDADPERVAQRLLSLLSMPFQVGDQELAVRASVGIATASPAEATAQGLLRWAGLATATAKQRGGSRHVVFQPEMQRAAEERAVFVRDLSAALTSHQLSLVFQPVVGMPAQIVALETLVRWDHPTRGLLSAGEFIPQAEAAGLIGRLDRWVLQQACTQAAAWTGALADQSITVNVSALTASSSALCFEVEGALSESGLDPRRLILEITETALVEDAERVAEQLLALKSLGVRVALDDFGTGYSSLSYLERLPFDWLKIDGTYSRRAGSDHRAQAMLSATLQLADVLGMAVVVEGIESPVHARLLRTLGVDLFQGYFFATPAPDTELPQRMLHAIERAKEIHGVSSRGEAGSDDELLGRLADRLQSRIDDAVDGVRRGLAAELHDEPLQALWAADLSLQSKGMAEFGQLAVAQQGVRQAMTRLRQLMLSMRGGEVSTVALDDALRDVVDSCAARVPAARFTLETASLDRVAEPDIALNAHRIVSEALANVLKHAQAMEVTVDARVVGHALELEIVDDGVGFDPLAAGQRSTTSGYGMTGMHDRASLMGGLLTVRSAPGEGTTVRALLPMRQRVEVG